MNGLGNLYWEMMVRSVLKRLGAEKLARPLKDRVDDYLTVVEVADYAAVSAKTVWREIRDGKLPTTRIRGKAMVKGSDALAWLSAGREG